MRKRIVSVACVALLAGCGGEASNPGPGPGSDGSGRGGAGTGNAGATGGTSSGSGGTATGPESRVQARAALQVELEELADVDAASLRERFPTAFEPAPSYEPGAIAGLDVIQASPLALTGAELHALSGKGFVISGTRAFPSFAYGYASIYMADLPVYISADSILDAVHRSYDAILKTLEEQRLAGELALLLDGMRVRLGAGVGSELAADVRADADTYLAVAASLLAGAVVEPVAGGSRDAVVELVEHANDASGLARPSLFGVTREEDFSQFKPRGHYTDSEALGRYFRAMMWLGRIDFRLFETEPDGARTFHRRQVEGMLLLHALVDADLRAHFDRIDHAVNVFVGEPDYMELDDVSSLLGDVGVETLGDVARVPDAAFAQAILEGEYGLQRISSHVMINGMAEQGTLPLSLSFAFFGQRYVIDSHVFSNVVYDRANRGRAPYRMLPNPLDVAFSALGNDQAAELLGPELEHYEYAPDLAAMRLLVDRHPPEFWSENLYNLWLS
ncbi:MAG TPA: DUF3160 domain-containing protein, partial [Polyangiaceae bacterium]